MNLTADELRNLIQEQESSGLSQEEFSISKGLKGSTFRNLKHRSKAMQKKEEHRKNTKATKKSSGFIRAEVFQDGYPHKPLLKMKFTTGIEIEFSIDQLTQVIKAAQAGAR